MPVIATSKPVWTREGVKAAVKRLHGLAGDPEAAHGAEDEIHREALRAIAKDSTDARSRATARLALLTEEIECGRWMA